MSHVWKVIGKVYNKTTGDFYGNIIGMSGGVVTVEVNDGAVTEEFKFTTQQLKETARIEWTNVTPAGWYIGEF